MTTPADAMRRIEETVLSCATRGGVSDDSRLVADLGLDSISMLELVLSLEEAVGHEISFEFLSSLSTVGDVRSWLSQQCDP